MRPKTTVFLPKKVRFCLRWFCDSGHLPFVFINICTILYMKVLMSELKWFATYLLPVKLTQLPRKDFDNFTIIIYGLFTVITVTTILAFPSAIFVLRSEDIQLYKHLLHTLQIWLPPPLPIICLSSLASLTMCFCGMFIMVAVGSKLGYVSCLTFWMTNLRKLW